MERNKKLLDKLLSTIESADIGGGRSLNHKYFFNKIDGIADDSNPGEFKDIQYMLKGMEMKEEGGLLFSQDKVTYHLKLLYEDDLIDATYRPTYDSPVVVVRGLTSKVIIT